MTSPTVVLMHEPATETGLIRFTIANEFANASEARKWLKNEAPDGTYSIANMLLTGETVKLEQIPTRQLSGGVQIRHRSTPVANGG